MKLLLSHEISALSKETDLLGKRYARFRRIGADVNK